MAVNAVDAGRKTAECVLKSGRHLMLYPGGEAEQLAQSYDQYVCAQSQGLLLEYSLKLTCVCIVRPVAFIKDRKGFVSLAVQFDAPIIPVYVFGESRVYKPSEFLLPLRCVCVQWCCRL